MPERREEDNGLFFWLCSGDFCSLCISFDDCSIDCIDDTEIKHKCVMQIRVSKAVFNLLKTCDKDQFIEYISNRFCYHFGFLLNHLRNDK